MFRASSAHHQESLTVHTAFSFCVCVCLRHCLVRNRWSNYWKSITSCICWSTYWNIWRCTDQETLKMAGCLQVMMKSAGYSSGYCVINSTNGTLRDVTHWLHQDVPYFQNVIRFHSTYVSVVYISQQLLCNCNVIFLHLKLTNDYNLRQLHYSFFFFLLLPNSGHGLLILEVPRLHKTTHHSR
jgi:hypothetical protein